MGPRLMDVVAMRKVAFAVGNRNQQTVALQTEVSLSLSDRLRGFLIGSLVSWLTF